jgi:hypothetical protein
LAALNEPMENRMPSDTTPPVRRSSERMRAFHRLLVPVLIVASLGVLVWVASAGATPPKISGPTAVLGAAYQPSGLACPSSTQCSVVGFEEAAPQPGALATFNPLAAVTPASTSLPTATVFAESVSCPLTTQCTAYGDGEMTFNPASPGSPTAENVDNTGPDAPAREAVIACPSSTQCTIVNYTSRGTPGREVTFNPVAPSPPPTPTTVSGSPLDSAGALDAVSCPTTTQCTAVDLSGNEVTFNPTAQGTPTQAAIDTGYQLDAIACPSVSQCTAVGDTSTGSTQEVTFNPASPSAPAPITVAGMLSAVGVACPSLSQCTIVGGDDEATFDPAAPAALTAVAVLPQGTIANVFACASSTECTEVTSVGEELTFNPIGSSVSATGSHLSVKSGSSAKIIGVDTHAKVGAKVSAKLTGTERKSTTLRVSSGHSFSWSLGKLKLGSYTAKFSISGKVIKTVAIKVAKK